MNKNSKVLVAVIALAVLAFVIYRATQRPPEAATTLGGEVQVEVSHPGTWEVDDNGTYREFVFDVAGRTFRAIATAADADGAGMELSELRYQFEAQANESGEVLKIADVTVAGQPGIEVASARQGTPGELPYVSFSYYSQPIDGRVLTLQAVHYVSDEADLEALAGAEYDPFHLFTQEDLAELRGVVAGIKLAE